MKRPPYLLLVYQAGKGTASFIFLLFGNFESNSGIWLKPFLSNDLAKPQMTLLSG